MKDRLRGIMIPLNKLLLIIYNHGGFLSVFKMRQFNTTYIFLFRFDL